MDEDEIELLSLSLIKNASNPDIDIDIDKVEREAADIEIKFINREKAHRADLEFLYKNRFNAAAFKKCTVCGSITYKNLCAQCDKE